MELQATLQKIGSAWMASVLRHCVSVLPLHQPLRFTLDVGCCSLGEGGCVRLLGGPRLPLCFALVDRINAGGKQLASGDGLVARHCERHGREAAQAHFTPLALALVAERPCAPLRGHDAQIKGIAIAVHARPEVPNFAAPTRRNRHEPRPDPQPSAAARKFPRFQGLDGAGRSAEKWRLAPGASSTNAA